MAMVRTLTAPVENPAPSEAMGDGAGAHRSSPRAASAACFGRWVRMRAFLTGQLQPSKLRAGVRAFRADLVSGEKGAACAYHPLWGPHISKLPVDGIQRHHRAAARCQHPLGRAVLFL